ncbi:MAG TPA: histidine phosphatase family protein [Candidatus Limnocylindrales bacterium]|nr:histidine phosphatase family protein [Candidatus Limnocylindrales bacterium]
MTGLLRSILCPLIGVVLACAAHAQPPTPDRSVVAELQKGGYVLFLRHFATNHEQQDTDPAHLDNIAAQRQLTDEGRKQAVALGEALRALRIPIGRIVCSQLQRARESATLLGVGTPEPTPDVTSTGATVPPEENQRRADALRKLLSTAPAAGKNTLIVSHAPNLQDAAGKEFSDIGEGEVVVFQPADGKYRVVARVFPPAQWTQWTKSPGP